MSSAAGLAANPRGPLLCLHRARPVFSKLLGALLYGIRPSDLITYVSAIGVLFAVALLACLIPGKRATSIDPTEALRQI